MTACEMEIYHLEFHSHQSTHLVAGSLVALGQEGTHHMLVDMKSCDLIRVGSLLSVATDFEPSQ